VTALRHAGSEAQQAQWLPKLAGGECVATLAVDERNKHHPEVLTTVAARQGSGYRLDGAKCLVLDGHVAELLIVAARTADAAGGAAQGISLFLVPAKTPGVSVQRTVMVDAHNAARLRFDNVELQADALLGTCMVARQRCKPRSMPAAPRSPPSAGHCRRVARARSSPEGTAPVRQPDRRFRPATRAATLYVDIELSRAALMKALTSLDKGEGATNAVAVAKAKCGNTATLAVQEGVQMHGGMGMTDEFEIGFFMKRARVLQELFGDAAFHMDRLARQRGY
jgi:alkylation response protein AidB-like acyl-CoA dehydrogenase